MFQGYKLSQPTFQFSGGSSRSSSDIFVKKPLDLTQTSYLERRSWKRLNPFIVSELPLTQEIEKTYSHLFFGVPGYQGMSKIFEFEVENFSNVPKLDISKDFQTKEVELSSLNYKNMNIALTFLKIKSPNSDLLKAILNYHGIATQGITSKIVGFPSKRQLTEKEKRSYSNMLRNIMVEVYAKCGGIPWSLSKPLRKTYYVGIAWGYLPSYYIFTITVFDSYGLPKYEHFRTDFMDRDQEFSKCIEKVAQRLAQAIPNGSKITIHYHGNFMGADAVFQEKLKEKFDFSMLSIERPNDPYFRFYNKDLTDNLSEKGIVVMLDEKRAILSTTGYPDFNIQGVPAAIFLESAKWLKKEELLIEAQDVYNLSQLNWAHARGYNKLPVTTLLASNIVGRLQNIHSLRQKHGLSVNFSQPINYHCFW
jgi:hypothetical protein